MSEFPACMLGITPDLLKGTPGIAVDRGWLVVDGLSDSSQGAKLTFSGMQAAVTTLPPNQRPALSQQRIIPRMRGGRRFVVLASVEPSNLGAVVYTGKYSSLSCITEASYKKQVHAEYGTLVETVKGSVVETTPDPKTDIRLMSTDQLFDRFHDLGNLSSQQSLTDVEQFELVQVQEELDRREFEDPASKEALAVIERDIKKLDTMAEIERLLESLSR